MPRFFSEMDDAAWLDFQKRLSSLMDSFYVLLPETKPQAIASVRESIGQMQSVVKQQLCSDAMRTVAAMAESLIQVRLARIGLEFLSSSYQIKYILGNVRNSTIQ